ncbi:LOW QUALITY PROTEIN: hypothetical protein OSB04_012159 [Centaurea solstitialis]|uniref:Reverse transcriptase Ty1/copia-type domain-containing protein n=1 Tax=Centaurea solstitialis TaxID=347529 RepID=A0AA38TML3_9ASTR|nr:LOW QUALITY PROTEIN: hypothetical protein OSB04_012159 [Centaurea solstitialis]
MVFLDIHDKTIKEAHDKTIKEEKPLKRKEKKKKRQKLDGEDLTKNDLYKLTPDGSIGYLKACLVSKGYSQAYSIDYKKKFPSIAKILQLYCSTTAVDHWPLNWLDIKNAFLSSIIEVYMDLLPLLSSKKRAPTFFLLKRKTLYVSSSRREDCMIKAHRFFLRAKYFQDTPCCAQLKIKENQHKQMQREKLEHKRIWISDRFKIQEATELQTYRAQVPTRKFPIY